MAVFCVGTMYINHVGVNVLNSEKAISSIGSDDFEYQSSDNSFSVHKNGTLVGKIPTKQKMKIKSSKALLQPHAIAVAGKVIAAGFAAAAAGSTFAAGAGTALTGAIEAIAGAGVVVGAACAEVPGAAAGSGMAVLMSIIVPVLIGAGIGSILA